MPCQVLSANTTQSARPAGAGLDDSRPASDGWCREFDFTPPTPAVAENIVTIVDFFQIITIAGDRIVTIA